MQYERLKWFRSRYLYLGTHVIVPIVCDSSQSGPNPTVAAVRKEVASRLHLYPQSMYRVVPTPFKLSTPIFVTDPEFDIDAHILPLKIHEGANEEELFEAASFILRGPMEHGFLWRIYVVEKMEHDRTAIIFVFHHSLLDGPMSFAMLGKILFDDTPNPQKHHETRTPRKPDPIPGKPTLIKWAIQDHARRLSDIVTWRSDQIWGARRGLHLLKAIHNLLQVFTHELHFVRRSILNRPLSGKIKLTVSKQPLPEIMEIKNSVSRHNHVTLNDVVLAVLCGAFRLWFTEMGVNLRSIYAKEPVQLSSVAWKRNAFMIIDLPLQQDDPLTRLLEIAKKTRREKGQDAETMVSLLTFITFLPRMLGKFVADQIDGPAFSNVLMSNIRAPTTQLYVLGAPVRNLYTFQVLTRSHALKITTVTQFDSIYFNLTFDPEIISNIEPLIDAFRRSIDELSDMALNFA